MWQCYSSLLHQHSFNQLQMEAEKASCDLSNLMSQPFLALNPLPSFYELSPKASSLPSEEELKQQDNCFYYQDAFLKTETIRTDMRQLQLKEWQLISLLLEKLRKKLKLPMSLVYLTKEDLRCLPHNRTKLLELLDYRKRVWEIQNQWNFPASFSLEDMEQLSLSSAEQQDAKAIASHAIRVAGNQQIIRGNAVIFQDNLMLDRLPKGSILIADNLLPEQVIACQHINGIILKKGGYLSHTSIIAREKNIPMVAQFKISEIKDKDKLLIQSGSQVTILSNKVIEWDFLDGMATTSDMGNKAQRLAMMNQKGFNLPNTIILKHRSIEKIHQLVSSGVNHDASSQLWHEYEEELKQILNQLTMTKSPIIVRSSTNVEDSSDYSYAGIFYSQPNINTTGELVSAICAAWQNVVDRAKVIQQYSGETQLALNLILQPYIKGQFGGVLFTESATPGLMQVEIAPGGVEGVTEGNAELTSLYIDERGQSLDAIGEKNSLSDQEYQMLYHLGRDIQALFGKPQDIEWILADQQFYIIQSRDISSASSCKYTP
jgi:phosphoenolpyruvate synthase/pyruvate phosphate dikinase